MIVVSLDVFYTLLQSSDIFLMAKINYYLKIYTFDISLNLPYIIIYITTMFHLLTIKSERNNGNLGLLRSDTWSHVTVSSIPTSMFTIQTFKTYFGTILFIYLVGICTLCNMVKYIQLSLTTNSITQVCKRELRQHNSET